MSGESPKRRWNLVSLVEIQFPNFLTAERVETEEISFCSERVDFSSIYQRSGPWPGGITDRVRTIIVVLPEDFTILLVQTEHALGPINFAAVERVSLAVGTWFEQPIRQINATL